MPPGVAKDVNPHMSTKIIAIQDKTSDHNITN